MDHTSSTPNLRVTLRDGLPSHLALKASKACIRESHRTIANKKAVFKTGTEELPTAIHLLRTERASNLGRALTTYFPNCYLRVQLLMSL